jgi:hypothetical protein
MRRLSVLCAASILLWSGAATAGPALDDVVERARKDLAPEVFFEFQKYLVGGDFKSFAVSRAKPVGNTYKASRFGTGSNATVGSSTAAEADKRALAQCGERASDCNIYARGNQIVMGEPPRKPERPANMTLLYISAPG